MVEESCVRDEECSWIFMKDYKEFPGMTSTDESYTIKPEACKNEVKKN